VQTTSAKGPVVTLEDIPEVRTLPRYFLSGDALEYGASLGNAHCWVTTRGSGAIQQFFSIDTGNVVTGNVSIRYGGPGHHLLRTSEAQLADDSKDTDVQLRPISQGTIEIHPAFQRRSFDLPENITVRETVFVPLTSDDDPAIAYYTTELRNNGATARSLNVFGFARLGGTFASEIAARFDPELRGFVASDRRTPKEVRVFGASEAVTSHEANLDFGRVYDVYHLSQLSNTTNVRGDVIAALQVSLHIKPGERRKVSFVLAFSPDGEDQAVATYRRFPDTSVALENTIEYLRQVTSTASVRTPDAEINQGVLWSKVNMLRVRARYRDGLAFTNDPGVSSNVVARDAAWFVYGSDHFMANFSRDLLNTFARLQYDSGKIPEYYNAIDGHVEDYGLNINDDTPLFILAVNHHFRATGDVEWLRGIYPTVARAAHYIISQRDERGLVFCTADDPRGYVWAICGWRNVIQDYSINGAVTEVNAECVAALRATGHLTDNLGLPTEQAKAFFDQSNLLRDAMNTHLINHENGMYFLGIDANGVARTDVTGDEVFPVIFRACPEEVAFRIIRRLNHSDFWTSAGLRTASADDPLYEPARNCGLLGGVWPGLTWWFAFAAARYHPDLMTRALMSSFSHYAAQPKKHNTVPGQFGEWFDGESLVNRGMRLSPWEPPRFLWAAIEGVCGVILQPGNLRIQPLIPAAWRWVALSRLPYHGQFVTYFAVREEQGPRLHIYSTAEVTTDHRFDLFEEDVTDMVNVLDPSVQHVALRRPGRTVLLLGHTSPTTSIVPIELGDVLPASPCSIRLYDSEVFEWRSGAFGRDTPVRGCSITIEAGGFRVLSFEYDV
jgi:hypothetical protein